MTTVDILICIVTKIRPQGLGNKMCEQRRPTFEALTQHTLKPVTEKESLVIMPSAWGLIKGLKIDDLCKANKMNIMGRININLLSPHYRKQRCILGTLIR